jgi:hypothetical protein
MDFAITYAPTVYAARPIHRLTPFSVDPASAGLLWTRLSELLITHNGTLQCWRRRNTLCLEEILKYCVSLLQ